MIITAIMNKSTGKCEKLKLQWCYQPLKGCTHADLMPLQDFNNEVSRIKVPLGHGKRRG